MNELDILNINNTNYEIADKQARDDIEAIRGTDVVLNVPLKTTYTAESKSLALSLELQKEVYCNA